MPRWHYAATDFAYMDELGYDTILKEAEEQNFKIKANSQFSTLTTHLDSRTNADVNPPSAQTMP